MPKDPETNMTKGYAFIEFTSPQVKLAPHQCLVITVHELLGRG